MNLLKPSLLKHFPLFLLAIYSASMIFIGLGDNLLQVDEGNDTFNVFAGEILGCLSIESGEGLDVLNLIGFGPYSATAPFGQTGFGAAFVQIFDPITGGQIVVEVSENDDTGAEIINGLLSPNPTIVDTLPEGCTS